MNTRTCARDNWKGKLFGINAVGYRADHRFERESQPNENNKCSRELHLFNVLF